MSGPLNALRAYCSTHEPIVSVEVVRVYRLGSGELDAVKLQAGDGATFTISYPRQWLSSADPQVWTSPESYGLVRWYCPGHGASGICPYGAHDEIRYPGKITI